MANPRRVHARVRERAARYRAGMRRTHAASLALALASALGLPASAAAAWVAPTLDRVILRAGPAPSATPLALAYSGERLRVTATRQTPTGTWRRIALDGRTGWLPLGRARATTPPRRWRHRCASRALGTYSRGRLACGRQLAAQGTGFRTWDSALYRSPSAWSRRWGTGRLVARIRAIARAWQARHPLGARLLVGDMSRPRGGPFTRRVGGIGHASHQNGLDVDIYYPRADGREREPFRPGQVDRRAARELVALVARSHPTAMFVGCRVGLAARGRAKHLCSNHENHMHVRYRAP